MTETVDPAGMLLIERDALLPILRRTPVEDFDRPTVLPGWSVRGVLAHCSAALTRLSTGELHSFSPADNDRDVADRSGWALPELLAELSAGYDGAAAAIADADGALDGFALGEWLHGGDVRLALAEPDAYVSPGIGQALLMLAERSRSPRLDLPATTVRLPEQELHFGPLSEPTAGIDCDRASLVRLCGGRSPDPALLRVRGAEASRYVMFH